MQKTRAGYLMFMGASLLLACVIPELADAESEPVSYTKRLPPPIPDETWVLDEPDEASVELWTKDDSVSRSLPRALGSPSNDESEKSVADDGEILLAQLAPGSSLLGLSQSAGSRRRSTTRRSTVASSFRPTPTRLGGRTVTSTPFHTGNFYGGASRVVTVNNTVTYAFHTFGNIVSGSAGSASAVLVFERDGIPPFNDFTTVGIGQDNSGDGNADTFMMSEPLPPNDVPTSPGPTYSYDGGTVIYTNDPVATTPQDGAFMDGELWYSEYSFTESFSVVLPGDSGAAVRRVKIAENNSPEPRDRLYFDYRFFKDVIVGTALI